MSEVTLSDILKSVRVSVVADICGLTPKAVYKWIEKGCLPRTEYTGETNYSEIISKASSGKFSPAVIRNVGKKKLAA